MEVLTVVMLCICPCMFACFIKCDKLMSKICLSINLFILTVFVIIGCSSVGGAAFQYD